MAEAQSSPVRTAVVGYDGSAASRAAVELAARAVGPDGTIHVIYVSGPPPEWQGTPYYQKSLEHHQEHSHQVLAGVGTIDVGGASVTTDAIDGPPAVTLAEVGRTRNADFIAVGSRGFGRFRAALGSVSHALLHEADRPVVIIPQSALPESERSG